MMAIFGGKSLRLTSYTKGLLQYSQTPLIHPWLIQLFVNQAKKALEQIIPY